LNEYNLLRPRLNVSLERLAMELGLTGKNILEVGIAGDEKPSGSYKFFGQGNEWKTLDKNAKWQPDIVADICDSGLNDNSFDLVIMTQVLEHIWDYQKALAELYRISKQYVIVDSPWMFPFHCDMARAESKIKWDDYWRFSPSAMFKLLKEVGFKEVNIFSDDLFVLTLCQKSQL
jgi:hypothetical protein